MKKLLLIPVLIILLPLVFASGSISTGSLNPSTKNLCGDNDQYVTITANTIINLENITLTSVSAVLFITGNPGLSFVTNQSYNIGNLNPLSSSLNTPSWTLQCSSPILGTYTAYVNYSSTNGYKASSYGEATSLLTVNEATPFEATISLIESLMTQDQEYEVINDNTPTVKVTTNRNSACKGSFDNDENYENMDFIFYGVQKEHNYTFVNQISEGSHTVYVRCKDEQDYVMQSSVLINFVVDTKEPEITVLQPDNKVIGQFTELQIQVSEESECRYEDHDDDFDDMDLFDFRSGNVFTSQLTELDEETHNYFVKCKDSIGNIAEREIEFEVEIPPKARIILEKTPPLSKGTFNIRLIPSKKLRALPELYYSFSDDPSSKTIVNLIKEGSYYTGYVIIEDTKTTRSGIFKFIGYDLNNNLGEEITEGAIFLVDTISPDAPSTVEVKATDVGVLLEWYYAGEKAKKFNIYRSTKTGVSHINYYASTTQDHYTDEDVINNQLYYYKIAAVDRADNIGSFSKEVSVYTTSGVEASETLVINKNPPTQDTRDWKENTEKDLDSLLIDLEWALTNLKDQAAKEMAVEDLALVLQVTQAKEDANKLQTQLTSVDFEKITDKDLREQLSKADALIARTKKTTPQSLEVIKSTSSVQGTAKSDVELAVNEFFEYGQANFTESQVKSYINQIDKINRNVRVNSDIKTIAVEYLDESKETRVLVKKQYSYESPEQLENIIVVEIIPKTVAGAASAIEIRTPGYNIIKNDPVFTWNYNSLSSEKKDMTYILLANDNSESAKTTKTIILVDPLDIIDNTNFITGFSVLIGKVPKLEVLGVIFGLFIILGLAMYYLVVVNEVDIKTFIKMPKLKIHEAKDHKLSKFSSLFKSESPIITIPEQYFHVKNGDVLRSITELDSVLTNMDDFTFYYHVHDQRNDLADWVNTVYHNAELADLIRAIKSKQKLIDFINELKGGI